MVDPRVSPNSSRRHGPSVPRIALVHDWLAGYRGGEAVLERLANLAGRFGLCAGLWVMVNDGRKVAPAVDRLTVHTSWLQDVPFAPTRLRRHLLPLYPSAVADLSASILEVHRRRPIDLVLSTSSAAVKNIVPPPGVPHVCYCHTPPRYLWSQQDQYASQGVLTRAGLALAGPFLRRWDADSSASVTAFIANSTHTAREILACYGRESTVIHPPARTEFFTPDPSVVRDDFWLVAGALEPYKRTDLAIEAARMANARIVVAGAGTELARLRARYESPFVTFLGRVSDQELLHLYRTAKLLVFPQVEDFGIVAVEAQSAGLPVVARRAGGALDSILDGQTGVFFDLPTPQAIAGAAEKIPQGSAGACRANALRFSESEFERSMIRFLAEKGFIRSDHDRYAETPQIAQASETQGR